MMVEGETLQINISLWYTFHNETHQKLSTHIFRTIKAAPVSLDLHVNFLSTSNISICCSPLSWELIYTHIVSTFGASRFLTLLCVAFEPPKAYVKLIIFNVDITNNYTISGFMSTYISEYIFFFL